MSAHGRCVQTRGTAADRASLNHPETTMMFLALTTLISLTTLGSRISVVFVSNLAPTPQEPVPAPAPASAPDTGAEAEAVLARARARIVDSEDELDNAGTLKITGTIQVQQMPLKGTFVELHHPAGQSRMSWTFPGFGDSVEGSDAGVFYFSDPMGIDIRRGWRAAAGYRILALRRHVSWKVMYEAAALDGFEEVAGERCHKVVMTPKSPVALGFSQENEELGERPKPDVWFVGSTTDRLHRVDMDLSVPNRGSGRLSLGFADWREVDGMHFPYATTRTMHGYVMVSTAEKVEVGVELAPGALTMPESVQKQVGAKPAPSALPDPGWKLIDITEQHTATVRVTCKPDEISRTLAGILPEVMRYLGESGATVAGPPFSRYHSVEGGQIDLEAGLPVTQPIKGSGRIKASMLPGGRAATGDHIGEYHRLGETHGLLAPWLASKGEAAQGGPWEVYWTDPGVEPDPRKWRTQIVQPLRAR
jgi:effector-binding domain-containing protein